MCVLRFIVLFFNFWKVRYSWCHIWCHMMLSGSAGLVAVSLFCPFYIKAYVYFVYIIWCSLVIIYFGFGGLNISGYSVLFYLFLLVSFPFSAAVIYKLSLGASLLFSSLFVFCF